MLIAFIAAYLLGSIALGLFAARRVHSTADYAVAGRSLPLYMVVATTFATWFGSELVLGVSAQFVQEGLGGVVEDPFGAGMCLVLVGLFFAYKLYKKNLITIGDYYRLRFGRTVEILCSIIIIFSYLGWVAAQVAALGLVFNLLTQGAMSITAGMVLGTLIVLIYTLYGGMWFITKAGRIFCGSSAISACTPSGMISTAAVTINMGTKANTMYSEPPMTGPSCATVASLDDMTRWNTSCCGMEPSIMVMPAAIKNSQVLPSAFSGSKRSLPCVVA